jgi:hypothetical protein
MTATKATPSAGSRCERPNSHAGLSALGRPCRPAAEASLLRTLLVSFLRGGLRLIGRISYLNSHFH